MLEADRPADALAYLALTGTDVWPGEGWHFVFGEADLPERTGVWSIYRNGDPAEDFTLCLKRSSNRLEEKDRRRFHLCPICLRKLCQVLMCKTSADSLRSSAGLESDPFPNRVAKDRLS